MTKYQPISPARINPWRPWTLKRPFLLIFILLCVLVVICIELIIKGCAISGCRVFGTHSMTDLSPWTNAVYNLMPTAVSLALGMVWVFPHHNILRLEPYFQMSVAGGAMAIDSLLLEYPYDIAFFVPWFAWKRR